MIKNLIVLFSSIMWCLSTYAQDYPQWPADRPETDNIEASQSREVRLNNHTLPQVIKMQDDMRNLITSLMENASRKLKWPLVELTEFSSDGVTYTNAQNIVDFAPYSICPPAGFKITFQFIVNKDSLQAWKNYQVNYGKISMNNQEAVYNNMQSVTESPLYKQYQDSVNKYMNLYTAYTAAHKDEGAALYTKDKHPEYYQRKENEFINKMTAMTQQVYDHSGIEQGVENAKDETFRFRNHTVVQVAFSINESNAVAIDQTLGPIESTSSTYPKPGVKISRIYSIPVNQENKDLVKWNTVLMMLLGNFQKKQNQYGGYTSGFMLNKQGDNHTPKKIKTDKVQTIAIIISGDKRNVEEIAKLIDVEKLNGVIVNN